jgi:hypothetical protein
MRKDLDYERERDWTLTEGRGQCGLLRVLESSRGKQGGADAGLELPTTPTIGVISHPHPPLAASRRSHQLGTLFEEKRIDKTSLHLGSALATLLQHI